MSTLMNKRTVKKMAQAFREGLASYPEHGEEGNVLMQEATESIMRGAMQGE